MTDVLREKKMAQYSVEEIADSSKIDELESDWNRLSRAASHPNVFTTFGWYKTWIGHVIAEDVSGRSSPYVLVLRRDGEVAGIVPLMLRVASPIFRVRKLQFVTPHSDYNDLVLGNDQNGLLAAVAHHLAQAASGWDVIELRELRDTGDGTSLLESALARAGLRYAISRESEPCPYLPIDGNAAAVMQRLSGGARRNLRRRAEKATAEGLRARIIEEPHREADLLRKMIALDDIKHLRNGFPSFIGSFAGVFQSLFDDLGPQGWLYVALLEQGERAVAFQLGFRCGGRLWDYSKAHDRAFARLAPGTLLLPALFDYGFANGFSEYDFLRGDEEYKLVWSAGQHRSSRILVWNRRALSRLRKLIYHNLKTTLRRSPQ